LRQQKGAQVKYNDREYYVLNEFDGCCVTVLKDTSFSMTHSIVIDGANKLIYDLAEKIGLELTKDNLSICCGKGSNFRSTTTLYGICKRSLND
jgi:hypothetical protein